MAKVGDILTVQAEEIILQPDGELAWLGAHVIDVDKARKEPYYANQAVDLARRGRVLQDARAAGEKAKPERESSPEPTGPRARASAAFWAGNWWKMVPKSGEGQYTYQHHWRGLNEDEAKLDEKDLLETDHSVHGDLRLTAQSGDLWGFSIFTGTTEDLRRAGGCRLCNLPPDDSLQGSFKLEEPREWLEVARHKPYISEPAEAGATAKKFAKFFEADYGRYHFGVGREHFFELFLDGDKLKGRYIIQYMPVGKGRRVWVISRPESQTPYAKAHKLEKVLEELKRKKQPVLIWSDGKQRPAWYDVATGEEFDPTKGGEKAAKPMPFVLTERTWAHTDVSAYDIFVRETKERVWNFETPSNPVKGDAEGMPYEAAHEFVFTDDEGKEHDVWDLKRGQSFAVKGGTHFNPTAAHRCRARVLDTGKVAVAGRDPLTYDFDGQKLKGRYTFIPHDVGAGTLLMSKESTKISSLVERVKGVFMKEDDGALEEGRDTEGAKSLGDWAEELGGEAYKAFLGHVQEMERLAEGEIALLAADELEGIIGGWLASTQEGQKVGRRLAGKWVKYLEDLKAEIDEYFGKLAEKFGSFLAHAKYEDRQETMPDDWASLLGSSKSGFKSFKGGDGKWRWIAWAASAFEDEEGEFFKTKALERYVAEAYKRGDHGKLWFYHLPLVMGDADFTALAGRILLKMGTWAEKPYAQKAAAYYSRGDGDWEASVGYKYRPKDREDKAYDWLWVFETSPVPAGKAAFPFSRFDTFGGKRMEITEDQEAKLKEVFGNDWKDILSTVESASKQLEDMGLAYKALAENDGGDLSSLLGEMIAEEAFAAKAKANPVQMLKLALGKIKDEAAKGLVQKVIDALEGGDYQYPKPEKKAKEEEECGEPKKKKADEEEEEEEYPKPKKAKKETEGEGDEASEGKKEAELPIQIEIEGLAEIVEAVKSLKETVVEQGEAIVGLKAMLDAGDEERAAQKIKKAPPVVAYKASVAGLLKDDKEEGDQEQGVKMSADHPLARLSHGTPLGPRGG